MARLAFPLQPRDPSCRHRIRDPDTSRLLAGCFLSNRSRTTCLKAGQVDHARGHAQTPGAELASNQEARLLAACSRRAAVRSAQTRPSAPGVQTCARCGSVPWSGGRRLVQVSPRGTVTRGCRKSRPKASLRFPPGRAKAAGSGSVSRLAGSRSLPGGSPSPGRSVQPSTCLFGALRSPAGAPGRPSKRTSAMPVPAPWPGPDARQARDPARTAEPTMRVVAGDSQAQRPEKSLPTGARRIGPQPPASSRKRGRTAQVSARTEGSEFRPQGRKPRSRARRVSTRR